MADTVDDSPVVSFLNPKALAALIPIVTRLGVQGVAVLARSYLGPLAAQVEGRGATDNGGSTKDASDISSRGSSDDGQARSTTAANEGEPRASRTADLTVLGMALRKLVFEAGELALHNPKVLADGKLPQFALDSEGRPPAISLAHVVAAVRTVQSWKGPGTVEATAYSTTNLALTRRAEARAAGYASRAQNASVVVRSFRHSR